MHDCAQSRSEEEQAEVQKCGPYTSIVLAVPKVKRKGKSAGCRFSAGLGGRGEPGYQSRNQAAIGVELGKCTPEKAFLRGYDGDVNDGKSGCQQQRLCIARALAVGPPTRQPAAARWAN